MLKGKLLIFSLTTVLTTLSFSVSNAALKAPAQASTIVPLAKQGTVSTKQSRENLAYSLGIQAYIYGYPLVTMEMKKRNAIQNKRPLNQFFHHQTLPAADYRGVVSPNHDTLYSAAYLDLTQGPLVLHVPDFGKRYYTIQLMDAWTNSFDYIGTRTTGTKEGDYVIVGPTWEGDLPDNRKVIKSPTNTVLAGGRILIDGENDIPNVTELQKQMTITPLVQSAQTSSSTNVPAALFDDQDPLSFFRMLTNSMKANQPAPVDEAHVKQFEHIGISATGNFNETALDEATLAGLRRAVKDGEEIIATASVGKGQGENGWSLNLDYGTYGVDYLKRAVVARTAFGANIPSESVYQRTAVDDNGDPLTGENRYVIHFAKDNLPPVEAFWSLTLYGADYYFVPNHINRYALGDRTRELKYNADGSLDIYLQKEPPAGKESNWLPTPEGDFNLMLRMYLPKPIVLEGKYEIPTVKKVSGQ
ncbi:DUF1254 domain-containing protein [Brevibacillus brevis]|uniref:DUF1254 domain-containing protein n=1 Tax=Brevibacillus brevis TaxID=1393 RepID=A0A2Z4MIJ9_BREBE|nr:DUF1254 domain-containing protein [Brevibacillus brevis]AWX56233.1 DUF1254 domain-containing protein [Brevibacillus brevis]